MEHMHMATRPGDYITAKCGRCNDITGHVVMVVLDGAIAKVECKACGSVHKYRDTNTGTRKAPPAASVRHVKAGQTRDNAKEVGRPSGGRTQGATRAPAPRNVSASKAEQAWNEAMLRHSGEDPLLYSMNSAYTPQTLIEHSAFGKGEVINVTPPDKMNVLFQGGVKVLRCKM